MSPETIVLTLLVVVIFSIVISQLASEVSIIPKWDIYIYFFFYQNIYYNVQTNNLQSTKINQNNMIKMPQTINITLQPMQ